MNEKIIKFSAANLCAMVLMLFVLIPNYSLIGLISYIAGAAALFFGTLPDKNKFNYGVTDKLDYMLWICLLTVTGIHVPAMLSTGMYFERIGNTNFGGLIVSLLVWVGLLWLGHNNKLVTDHYIVKRCIKYAGVGALFLAIHFFWDIPFNTYIVTLFVTLFFMLIDIYNCKCALYTIRDYIDTNRDYAYWMAISLNVILVAMNLFFRPYTALAISSKMLQNTLEVGIAGFRIPVFCAMMTVLALIFAVLYNKKEGFSYRDTADCYFVLSLGGFVLCGAVYIWNSSPVALAIYIFAAMAYLVFGFSIPSADYSSTSNPVYFILRKSKNAHAAVSLLITALAVPGIIFSTRGYVVSIIFFVCAAAAAVATFLLLKGGWVKMTLRYQILLVCILAYLISVAATSGVRPHMLVFLIFFFFISSLSVWTMGIRQDIFSVRANAVIQSVLSAAFGVIGLIAVG